MVIAGEDIDMVIYALSVLKMMLNEGHVKKRRAMNREIALKIMNCLSEIDRQCEEMEKIMNDAFEEEFDALTDKAYTAKATINLVQKDGEWKVTEIDSEGEVMNALTGNLVNAIKEINESFEEWE